MKPSTIKAQNDKLTQATNLLDRLSAGGASAYDLQEAKRLVQEHRKDMRWINPDQVYRLACMVVEGFGGKRVDSGSSWTKYRIHARSWFGGDTDLCVSREADCSAFVDVLDPRNKHVITKRHHITTGSPADDLRELISWLHK
jgi:hypothetical protein